MFKIKDNKLIILGIVTIIFLFILYSRYQESESIVPESVQSMERLGIAFYIIIFFSIAIIGIGLHKYYKQKVSESSNNFLNVICQNISDSKSKKIFIISFILYGIFFSFSSGILVYQPDVVFSVIYGVEIPSWFIAPCCGDVGYMPKILVYLTEHIGFQIIPINLLLQMIVSFLVSLNISLVVKIMSTRSASMGSTGMIMGLFIGCPTCTGTILSIFFGTMGWIGLSIYFVQLQTLLIGISIPVLIFTPLYMAKKLNKNTNCPV